MAVDIADVPKWAVSGGIGHALGREQQGWYFTLCGMMGPSFDIQDARPRRICRRCRALLNEATLRGRA